jgi:hypothetical protein
MSTTKGTMRIAETPGRESMSTTTGSQQQQKRQQQQKHEQQHDTKYSREGSHSK